MPRDALLAPGNSEAVAPPSAPRAARGELPLAVATLLGILGVSAAALVLAVPGLPGAFLTWPLAVSLWQLSVTPFCRATGIYLYHSPMLKATLRNSRVWEIHGGTTWDWIVLFRFRDRGAPSARRVMAWYLEGLLDIARRVEAGEVPPTVLVTGTSYFFSAGTARKLGFEIRRAGPRLRLNLLLNGLDLWLTYSFTRGRLALPDLLDVKQAVIRGGELVRRKNQLRRIREMLGGRPDAARRRSIHAPAGQPRG